MLGNKRLLVLLVLPIVAFFFVAIFLQKTHSLKIRKYQGGTPVYTDRCYADQRLPESLNGLSIIAMTRHFHFPITLKAEEEMVVYRFIAQENENQFVDGWEKLPLNINIQGKSSTFNEVYKKTFSAGKYLFKAGGPVAASPLLFDSKGNVSVYYKTNYLFPEGLMAYKTKLLMFFSLFLNYAFFLYVLHLRQNNKLETN